MLKSIGSVSASIMGDTRGADPEVSEVGFTVKSESRAYPNLGRGPFKRNLVNLKGNFLDYFFFLLYKLSS